MSAYGAYHGLVYRQKLRRLEVALIEYRESLEERGVKNLEEIEKKVQSHRKRLQVEYGLSDSGEDGHGHSKFFLFVLCLLKVIQKQLIFHLLTCQ